MQQQGVAGFQLPAVVVFRQPDLKLEPLLFWYDDALAGVVSEDRSFQNGSPQADRAVGTGRCQGLLLLQAEEYSGK